MERRIDPDAPLDYVEVQIFPSLNSYEASVSTGNRAEKVASGPLEQLLLHSPQVKDLSSKGSNSNFKILPPDDVDDADWFTTATLTRFLHIVGSPDILSIGNEISQLEETRKFQLSLFAKAEVDMTSSFESKNELVRAVDLRLSALKEKLGDALNQATGARCSPKDISDLENFAHHFGAEDIRDSLQKFVELSQFPSIKDPKKASSNKTERSASTPRPSQLDPPVKYGVSPAKVAQIERQNSTESETSFSSEEDQPSVERSRTITRSATPRRAASPMRRIQIGRSGSRRAATLSIRCLNHFPATEKAATQRDAAANSSEEEDSEKPHKQNVLRMSVQDKISLFESKQKNQGMDTQKTKSLLTAVVANKAVPRRWSSGMGESATQCLHDASTSSPLSPKDLAPDKISESQNSADTAENIESYSPEKGASETLDSKVDNREHEREGSYEKHPASIEWSQQKEAELNQLFMKMMESKPVRHRNVTSDNSKSKSSPKEQRGGFYDHYKQKRDEKLRKEAAGKKAEKEAQFKEMQQFLDERKAEMASSSVSDVNRRHTTVNKPQNTQKNSTQLANSRKEALKPSVAKKTTSKPSHMPATRKSWPSTASPRATGVSPAKTPSGATSTSATSSRNPPSVSSAVRSSTKVEKLQPRPKTLKATQPDANKSVKTVNEKRQPTVTIVTKTAKAKVRTEVDIHAAAAATTTAKPSFYNKVTKKSSVVPLETKPFLRKGSGIGPGVGPVVVKSKVVAQPEEPLRSSGDLIQAEEYPVVKTTDVTSQNQEECEPLESCAKLDSESRVVSPTKREESESSDKRIEISGKYTGTEEESTISPTAWVEIEEHQQDEIVPCKESPIQIAGPANLTAPAGVSSPRVRHSLFQMLLEETSEADTGEWGNAEHPPAMIYQKDAPKGLKRFLKFARKTKADSHLTGGSSPSAFSEGEDDAEESKGQSDMSKLSVQNHPKMPETKATRSFFSALRGSKTNETKLPYH